MEFGIFHEFLSTKSLSQAEAFRQSFAQIEAAEEWGLQHAEPRAGDAHSLKLYIHEVMPHFK
jgi:hypothetical protein